MATQSKARAVFDPSDTGVESRSKHGCVYAFIFVVLSCVVEALRRADNPSKESYQMSIDS
jgi:hypothetical protein